MLAAWRTSPCDVSSPFVRIADTPPSDDTLITAMIDFKWRKNRYGKHVLRDWWVDHRKIPRDTFTATTTPSDHHQTACTFVQNVLEYNVIVPLSQGWPLKKKNTGDVRQGAHGAYEFAEFGSLRTPRCQEIPLPVTPMSSAYILPQSDNNLNHGSLQHPLWPQNWTRLANLRLFLIELYKKNVGLLLIAASELFITFMSITVKFLNGLEDPVPILEVRALAFMLFRYSPMTNCLRKLILVRMVSNHVVTHEHRSTHHASVSWVVYHLLLLCVIYVRKVARLFHALH